MKRQIVICLLLIALIAQSITAESRTSSRIFWEGLEIDLEKSYSAKELFEIIDIVLEESAIAIEHAYAEGYKAGLLESLPEKEYYRVLSDGYQKELDKKNKEFKLPWWTNLVAFCSGVICTLFMAR